MKGILLIIFIAAFIFAYIYFGYYQDYKRNPKEFKRSVLGMPIALISIYLGNSQLSDKIKNWANLTDEIKRKANKKSGDSSDKKP